MAAALTNTVLCVVVSGVAYLLELSVQCAEMTRKTFESMAVLQAFGI